MNRRLLILPLAALAILTTCSGASADPIRRLLGDHSGYEPLPMPPAPAINPDQVVIAPGENRYAQLGSYGQPYYLNIDSTVNWTDVINRSYFNPGWRGETWTPTPLYWIVERQSRLFSEWPEYNEQNIYRVGNKWCQFLERFSGFGPGPGPSTGQ
ncbi:MAG TPA: hypothetical protein V6D22_08190 [Candidatus Obscuribacterales bacterium]